MEQLLKLFAPDVFELAELLRPSWPELSHEARASGLVGEGDGDGDGDGDDGDKDDDGDKGGKDADADPKGDKDGDDGWSPPSRKDWDGVQQQLRETSAELKKVKAAEDTRKRKEAEDEGNFKSLAEQEKERADQAEARAEKVEREARVTRIASRKNFRDPADVMAHLSDEDASEDRKAERAIEKLAKEKPYLVSTGNRRQRDPSGDGDDGDAGDMNRRIRRAAGRAG
jgi:hypothetical protein